MFKALIPLAFAGALALTACSSSSSSGEAIPDLSQNELYKAAQASMAAGEYGNAQRYLEALDSRYPFGELTDQVQLDLIYVYYKQRTPEQTTAAIDRYLRLNPTSQYTDYVMYMRGLNEVQKHGNIIRDFIGLDSSQKDPTNYYKAIGYFKDLIAAYPNSPYCKDAYQRIIYIKDQLARREWLIASYYQERGALISAIRHCQAILYSYRDSDYTERALEMMDDCYKKLGLSLPADNTQKVIAASRF